MEEPSDCIAHRAGIRPVAILIYRSNSIRYGIAMCYFKGFSDRLLSALHHLLEMSDEHLASHGNCSYRPTDDDSFSE